MPNRDMPQILAGEPAFPIADDDRRFIEKIMTLACSRRRDASASFSDIVHRIDHVMVLRQTIAPENFDPRAYYRACLQHAIDVDRDLDGSRPAMAESTRRAADRYDLDSDIPF